MQGLESADLPTLITALCASGTGPEHLVYARKEYARALGAIASSICPVRQQAISSNNLLAKMLQQLKKALADADSSVREAASEGLASIAGSISEFGVPPSVSSSPHPVLKVINECLSDGKKEVQAAACLTLGLSSPFLGGGVIEPQTIKDLLKRYHSPAFLAHAALLNAFVSNCDSPSFLNGLIKTNPGSFSPHLSTLIGQPNPVGSNTTNPLQGSGAIGALASKDWATRKAGVDLLRGTALIFGPLMEPSSSWDAGDAKSLTARCIRSLESVRFDKISAVRDAARDAISLIEELRAYGKGGGGAAGWGAVVGNRTGSTAVISSAGGGGQDQELMVTAAPPVVSSRRSPSPLRRSSPSRYPPPRRSPSPGPALARALDKNSSINERFRQAHKDDDEVYERRGRDSTPRAMGGPGDDQDPKESMNPPVVPLVESTDEVLDVTMAGLGLSNEAGGDETRVESVIPSIPDVDEVVVESPPSTPPSVGPQDEEMEDRFFTPTEDQANREDAHEDLPAAQYHPVKEEPVVEASRPMNVPFEQWEEMQKVLAQQEEKQRELLSTIATLKKESSYTIEDLQGRLSALERNRSRSPSPSPPTDRSAHLANFNTPPDSPINGALGILPAASTVHSGDLPAHSGDLPAHSGDFPAHYRSGLIRPLSPPRTSREQLPLDVDAAFSHALSLPGVAGSIALMELLTKPGPPLWNELRTSTALQLLRSFAFHVSDPGMMKRVLPWLWRLADEDQAGELPVPQDLKEELLHGLGVTSSECSKRGDVDMAEKVELLGQTLISHWSSSEMMSSTQGLMIASPEEQSYMVASFAPAPSAVDPPPLIQNLPPLDQRDVPCQAQESVPSTPPRPVRESNAQGGGETPGGKSARVSSTPGYVRTPSGNKLGPKLHELMGRLDQMQKTWEASPHSIEGRAAGIDKIQTDY